MTTLRTPWGKPDHVEDVGQGILHVSTPSHGGYYVPPVLNAKIPQAWRAASFNTQGMRGWYEEDCDWCLVALTFPEHFPQFAAKAAAETFKFFFADKLS